MKFESSIRNRFARLLALAASATALASGDAFGHVVPVGGHASDFILDGPRGVLDIANYTSSCIDVMPLKNNAIGRSTSVPAYPRGLAPFSTSELVRIAE
jgi:hypothetical protein